MKIKYKYIETDGFAGHRFLIKASLILLFQTTGKIFCDPCVLCPFSEVMPETGREETESHDVVRH